jgi:hypothetical protein
MVTEDTTGEYYYFMAGLHQARCMRMLIHPICGVHVMIDELLKRIEEVFFYPVADSQRFSKRTQHSYGIIR